LPDRGPGPTREAWGREAPGRAARVGGLEALRAPPIARWIARLSGLASKFGSFYDSTLDRISEVVVYLGLLSLYHRYQADLTDITMVYLILLAMAGSLMVSYTRARAEALGSTARWASCSGRSGSSCWAAPRSRSA
jgi:CDP-diacylglycerol--glycerol-3-phosphate 3-phosphatidyltransferase